MLTEQEQQTFLNDCELIRTHANEKLSAAVTLVREVVAEALSMFQQDILDPRLNDIPKEPDWFMARANYVGLALFDNGMFEFAEQLYLRLADETCKYRAKAGEHRHAGALYANVAGARFAQGIVDAGVVALLKAAQEDTVTYGIPAPKHSYAIQGLLKDYFGDPLRKASLEFGQQVNPSLVITDVEDLCKRLGQHEYAFLAYIHLAVMHMTANQESPNEYSQLQIFSALRSLSSLLEVELKEISGNKNKTLFPTIETLFGNKAWWGTFDHNRNQVGAIQKSSIPVDNQLRDAIAIVPTDDHSLFWKSLLVAYILRNYTIHQLETQCALVQTYSQEALGHILHVMITADRHI